MAHWKTEQYAKSVDKAVQSAASERYYHPNCTQDACPHFQTCTQVPSQGYVPLGKKAKVFFVNDSVTPDEAEFKIPAIHPAGKLMREALISTFVRATTLRVPYLITKLFRADLDGKAPRAFEARLCFSFFLKELKEHKPEVLAVFGVSTFQALYNQALNKSELPAKDEQQLNKLRGKFFNMMFEGDIIVSVYVAYPPGLVMQAPASYKFLLEDAFVLKRFFYPEEQKRVEFHKPSIEVMDTPQKALDYLDFLLRGLPKKVTVAFDTETENLNRKFNNRFLTWQFCHEADKAVVIPIEHKDKPIFADPVQKKRLQEATNKLFNAQPHESQVAWFTGHNIKFDLSVLWGLYGVTPRVPSKCVPWWCTMLGMHWLDENRKSLQGFLAGAPYSLKTLGIEFFSFHFEEEALDKRGDGSLEQLSFEQLALYGGTDSSLTRAIMQFQLLLAHEQDANVKARTKKDYKETSSKLQNFQKYYYFPASRALAVMECNGLYVKPEHLSYLQGEDSPVWGRMKQIDKEIQELPDVLEYRKQFKDKIGGRVKNASEFESDLWSIDLDEDLPLMDLNKKDQQFFFFLDFLKLKPLKLNRKTQQPQLNSKFLEHYSKPTIYKESETIKKVCYDFYNKVIGQDEKEGSPIYRDNPLQMELEYRKLKKLGTAYLDSIEGYIRNVKGDSIDGRVRASFNIHGTDTGRLSSSKPNLQQLPSGRTKYAKEVKNLFQAEPPSEKYPDGTILIQGDYKTAEVRWAALFSKDRNLISVFSEAAKVIEEALTNPNITDEEFNRAVLSSDLHRRTASLVYGLPAEKINKAQRQASKAVTFGLLFGMTVKTLAENNGWTLEEGEEILKKYFSAFPDLERWLKNIPKEAKWMGFVETFMGRRRRLDHLFKIDEWKFQTDAERKAMNSSIQGQSSDAGTIGMFNFMQYIFENNLEDKWLIQNIVHDSCLVQVPFYDLKEVLSVMKKCFVKGMQTYIENNWNCKLPIPIEMEFEIGLKYGNLIGWDGRLQTLEAIIQELERDKLKVWEVKTGPRKPSKALDLVSYTGK